MQRCHVTRNPGNIPQIAANCVLFIEDDYHLYLVNTMMDSQNEPISSHEFVRSSSRFFPLSLSLIGIIGTSSTLHGCNQ